jgi:hypothetical protein
VVTLRDGEARPTDVSVLVPGDVIALNRGDVLPADARVIVARELTLDESALTGESAAVGKRAESLAETYIALQITARNHEVTELACRTCHTELTASIDPAHPDTGRGGPTCTTYHDDVGHISTRSGGARRPCRAPSQPPARAPRRHHPRNWSRPERLAPATPSSPLAEPTPRSISRPPGTFRRVAAARRRSDIGTPHGRHRHLVRSVLRRR